MSLHLRWASSWEDTKVSTATGASFVWSISATDQWAERQTCESRACDTTVTPSGTGRAEVDEAVPSTELTTFSDGRQVWFARALLPTERVVAILTEEATINSFYGLPFV